ncbi:hypothetical protein BX666DRAFT_1979707, partial [Dichotomocladium elegans]
TKMTGQGASINLQGARVLRAASSEVAGSVASTFSPWQIDNSEVVRESHTASILQSGIEIAFPWSVYRDLAIEQASLLKLCLVSDLQKVLALPHVLLLIRNSNDDKGVKAFGQSSIKKIYNEFRLAYFDTSIELGDGTLNSLCDILKELLEAGAAEDDDGDDARETMLI